MQLTQGKYCVIDLDDLDILDTHTWRYAIHARSSDGILMHRYIISHDKAVCHINGNILDNRKNNLVGRTSQQTSRKVQCNNKSGVTGVFYDVRRQVWVGHITRHGIKMSKSFPSLQDAIRWRLDKQSNIS